MFSYFHILLLQSAQAKVNLKDAFLLAGISDSTYYRAMHGRDLKYLTAYKVVGAIEKLSALQERDTSH
jgi:predicted transcriptional regulator